MTDQKITASTVAEYIDVFRQAQRSLAAFSTEGNGTASRLARRISLTIEERLLDEMDCLRALVAEQEAADAEQHS